MAVSKVVYDGETLVDLTEDSVTPTSMLSGTTAHDASGEQIEGELMTLNGTTEETPNSVAILVPYSDFGDATAEDVLAGKTFTSSAGLKVVGTGEVGGGGTAKPVLYGTYLLKESIDYSGVSEPIGHSFGEVYDEDYAYCYPAQTYDLIERSSILHIEFEPDQIGIIPNHVDLHLRYQIATGYWEVVQEVDYDEYTQPFPAERCRILEFNKPYEVSQEFYDLFMSIIDNTDGTAYGIGHTDGVKTQYDEFWDDYQDNGNRGNYEYAFAGLGWNDENFKPKYDIVPVEATHIFTNTAITDIIGCLNKAGVVFDFSKCISTAYIMQGSQYATNFPTVDLRKRTHCNYGFFNCPKLHTIEKVILKDDGSQGFTDYSFGQNPELVEIRFEGVIGKNGLNLQWSTKLSRQSIASIISCLSSTKTGLSITLSLAAVNKAYERSEGANDGSSSAEWSLALAAAPNWTINLV